METFKIPVSAIARVGVKDMATAISSEGSEEQAALINHVAAGFKKFGSLGLTEKQLLYIADNLTDDAIQLLRSLLEHAAHKHVQGVKGKPVQGASDGSNKNTDL